MQDLSAYGQIYHSRLGLRLAEQPKKTYQRRANHRMADMVRNDERVSDALLPDLMSGKIEVKE